MFFDVFKGLCERKGISPKRAAEDMGLSNSITTKWKKTGATPNGETLNRIADYFGVTADFLLGRRPPEGLSHEEEELVRLYRALSAQGKRLLRSIGELLFRQEGGAEKA